MTAWFIIAKKWRKSKYPSSLEWINQMWCSCTTENYSVTKRNKASCKSMKNIILFVFKKESRYAFEHAWKTGKLQEKTQEND